MISAQQIQDILSLYAKFGWTLRRVLLTPKLKNSLADSAQVMFANVEVVESEVDAAWFSRASGQSSESWELRHLHKTPYALIEVFDNDEDETICEEVRHEMEAKLKGKT